MESLHSCFYQFSTSLSWHEYDPADEFSHPPPHTPTTVGEFHRVHISGKRLHPRSSILLILSILDRLLGLAATPSQFSSNGRSQLLLSKISNTKLTYLYQPLWTFNASVMETNKYDICSNVHGSAIAQKSS